MADYTSIYNGAQVDAGISKAYTPTLQAAPTSSTLTYTRSDLPAGSQTVNFIVGQTCRVANANNPSGYDVYQLIDLVTKNDITTAIWNLTNDANTINKSQMYETIYNALTLTLGIQLGGYDITEITNPEWSYVLCDSTDKILAGIKTDGSLYIAEL